LLIHCVESCPGDPAICEVFHYFTSDDDFGGKTGRAKKVITVSSEGEEEDET
jgi:hypothetical protein